MSKENGGSGHVNTRSRLSFSWRVGELPTRSSLHATRRDFCNAAHAILDNYATHKHPKVVAWLARHPRWVFHFTPTSASWLNAIAGFFSILTHRRLKRGSFASTTELKEAIARFIREHNKTPKPFVWTQSAEAILANSTASLYLLNESVH